MLQSNQSDSDDDSSTLTADSPDNKNPEVKEKLEELNDAKIVLDETKIKAEMCSEKLDALKELIQSANKTVASIVPETPNLLDVEASVSRSNSDSSERAGKYHKKPAPKAPKDEEQEFADEDEQEKPLKATLVIKTGITNNQAVDAVIKKRRKVQEKKIAARDSFSKFLTIPKNIFHNAFHRDDDARSLSSRSRSGSREKVDALFSANSTEDITYISLKPDSIDSDISTIPEKKEETDV